MDENMNVEQEIIEFSEKTPEDIKKEKSYLFKTADTEGFNPATPQNKLSGVEAKFYELNPALRPGSNQI